MNKKDPFEMDVSALDEIFKDFDEALKSDDFSTPDMYDIPELEMDLDIPELDLDIDFDLDIDLDF